MSLPEQHKVKFKCKRSGNFVSFTNEIDIAGLRIHEGYIEVKEEIKNEEIKEATKTEVLIPVFQQTEKAIKQRGRPKKNHI
jgi:hypothetical protein